MRLKLTHTKKKNSKKHTVTRDIGELTKESEKMQKEIDKLTSDDPDRMMENMDKMEKLEERLSEVEEKKRKREENKMKHEILMNEKKEKLENAKNKYEQAKKAAEAANKAPNTLQALATGQLNGIYTMHLNENNGLWTSSNGEIKFDGNEFKGTVIYDNHDQKCPFEGKIDEQLKCTFKLKYYGTWYDYKCDFKEVDGSVGFVGLWKNSSVDSFPSYHRVVFKLVKKE